MTALRKFGAMVSISREMLLDLGLVEPTEEPPGWPCATVTTVAEAVGITVPPDLDLADRP